MKKEQISEFLKGIGIPSVKVLMLWDSCVLPGLVVKDVGAAVAFSPSRPPTLIINRSWWTTIDKVHQKAVLMHEAGHLRTQTPFKSRAHREYLADRWALNKAKKLKKKAVYHYLRALVRERLSKEGSWRWNGPYRSYIIAAKRLKEQGYV